MQQCHPRARPTAIDRLLHENPLGSRRTCCIADAPGNAKVYGVVLFNISLRMLHTSKQSALSRPLVKGLQWVLRETPIGPAFFGSVAKVQTLLSESLVRGEAGNQVASN